MNRTGGMRFSWSKNLYRFHPTTDSGPGQTHTHHRKIEWMERNQKKPPRFMEKEVLSRLLESDVTSE